MATTSKRMCILRVEESIASVSESRKEKQGQKETSKQQMLVMQLELPTPTPKKDLVLLTELSLRNAGVIASEVRKGDSVDKVSTGREGSTEEHVSIVGMLQTLW